MTLGGGILLLALVAAPADTAGNALRGARMNAYVDRLDAFGFAGQVLLEDHGQILLDRNCGFADRRFGVANSRETIFGIGSITKTFTAAAILRLESQGRLRLGDRLAAHLPGVPADKAGITIEQLLSHRSGLRLDADLPDEANRDEVVRRILAQPLGSAPGGEFSYSNIGFDLLGAVIERVSGTDYDTFVRRELLAPAGMDHTGRAGASRLAPLPAARGETEWGPATALREWPPAWHGTGAGRMVSNAHDLLKWAHALSDGRVLTAREHDLMFERHANRPGGNGYGYGMQLATLPDGTRLRFHGGDVPGYRSEMRIEPDLGRVIVVVTNQDIHDAGVQRRVISNTLSRLARDEAPDLPPDAIVPGPLPDAVGSWQLPGGGRIEVVNWDGRLRLSATGQDAVDLFEAAPDTAGTRREATRLSQALLEAAIRGDSTAAAALLPHDRFEDDWEFLSRNVRTLTAAHGPIDSVECLGSSTLPFQELGTRCYFRLHVRDGVLNAFLAWDEGRLTDATFGEPRPAPTLLPVAPLRAGGYATFDILRTHTVPFRIVRLPDGALEMRIPAPGGEERASLRSPR